MKKSILIFFACVILYTLASAQQVNQDIIPASTGLNLGRSNQRWNGFIRNLDISGTCFVNGMACFGNGIQHTTFAGIPPEIDGTLIYCTDCQQTNPCLGGGTGAFGEGINGVWSCSAGTGLNDPGSNGLVKRTAPNITGVAGSADVINLFTGCSGTQYLGADGACHTSSGAPLQALPASPLINQGASTPPVYAAGVTYHTTAQNWSESHTNSLTGGSASSLTLAAGYSGIDVTSGFGYQVYLSDGANSEAVNVTGGTYTFAGGGTILFTPFFNHGPAAYTVGSASSGIQETINSACGTNSTYFNNYQCNVTIPANGPGQPPTRVYNVQGSIYLHTGQMVLSGYGVTLSCTSRGPCINIGAGGVDGNVAKIQNSNNWPQIVIKGLSFRSPTFFGTSDYHGSAITNAVKTIQIVTITTAAAHNLRPGELVTIMFTDNSRYWGDKIVATVPTPTTFTYADQGPDIATAATPGVVALAYEPFLVAQTGTHLVDISYDRVGENGNFNTFFDFWDDEAASIEHFVNNGIPLASNANWSGSFIFSGGNPFTSPFQFAPVISVRDSSITANDANCFTVFNSNGLYIENTVCQASGPWQVYSSNTTGNFQGAYIKNIYSESTLGANPFGSMTGSVTSGVFQTGELWVQSVTGATLYARNAPVGSGAASVTLYTGTPDNNHTWTGQTSLAVYTPTSLPGGYRSPFPGTGIAGLIAGPTAAGGVFKVTGSGGMLGTIQTGGAGATPLSFWVVAHDTISGAYSSPMRVLDWSSTGSDLIPVQWPRVANGANTIVYDVIRSSTPSASVPSPYNGGCTGGSGGTCGSVATSLSQATACGGTLVCSFQDIGSSTTSAYTINAGTFGPALNFWPGAIVTVATPVTTDSETSPLVGVGPASNTGVVPVLQVSNSCSAGVTSASGYTVCNQTKGSNNVPVSPGTMLTDVAANPSGATPKGRFNFGGGTQYPHAAITLVDSNILKTRATQGFRPTWDAADTWIGTDVAAGGVAAASSQLAFGAPIAIDNYINSVGDGTSYLERLTASLKILNVNLQMSANKAIDLVEGTPPSGSAGHDFIWGDSTSHRVMMNSNNTGALDVVGISAAGTSGHLAAFAANGIDLVDGGAAGAGTVTSSGPPSAGQVASFSTATNIVGAADFLYTAGTPNKVTVPGASPNPTLIFSGTNNVGIGANSGAVLLFAPNNVASSQFTNVYRWNGSSYINNMQMQAAATSFSMLAQETGQNVTVSGKPGTTTNTASVALFSNGTEAATSGVQANTWSGGSFAPASGTAAFHGLFTNPVINQTGGANGTIRIIAAYPVNTAVVGTQYLIAAGTAASQAVNAVLTDKFTVDSSGNVVSQGSVTATTSVKGATYLTATNCTATGTAANPSVVSCSAAPAGAFSCDVAASAGTCTVNTTAVTANSEIAVHLNSYTGTRLGVTCNTGPTAVPAIYVASIVAGTSFTINMPTITTNPACFDFTIVN